MQPEQGVRLQDIRNFTVRILNPDTEEIVGTGIVVTRQGGIVTCAHVVEAALGIHPRDAGDASVGVYFPRLMPEKRRQTAKIARIFPNTDDDIVLLQVTEATMFRLEQVAQLGRAGPSKRNDFESYGYRRLEDFVGGWAYGTIQGSVEAPDTGTFLVEPIQLRSDQINAGMSGAAVLDQQRNLVVGLVSDTWFPDKSGKDRDTAWAVDGQVLTFDPIALPLREEPVPLLQAPQPRTDKAAALQAVAIDLGINWNTAPNTPAEWVGRNELLLEISKDWADPRVGITGLIGFGGEGKSSLARKWVDDLIEDPTLPRPDGIFWWGFYEKPNAEEFFESLLRYMSKDKIDATKITSASAKAQIVGAMLASGRYLFILDGFEVMQFQDGDRYGEVQSHPLAEFLTYIAAPDHESYALVTSRVQLHDLASYITYRERSVSRLSTVDGVALLEAFGCHGPEDALATLVENWDGHALTLKLLGSYLADGFAGDVLMAKAIPPPTAREHRYDRVHRVLRRYDEHFTATERALLLLICACRAPVPTWFAALPSQMDETPEVLQPLAPLDEDELVALINRLLDLRILRHDKHNDVLTAHPLIRSYYQTRLKALDEEYAAVHLLLTEGYLTYIDFQIGELLKDPDKESEILAIVDLPLLEEILPGVEAIYHACQAGRHDIGIIIHTYWIGRNLSNYLSSRYGAHETELDICLNFFPNRDITQQPVFQSYQNKASMPFLALGQIPKAIQLLRRNTQDRIRKQEWANATENFPLLSEAYVLIGDLEAAEQAMKDCLLYLEKTVQQGGSRASDIGWKRWIYQANLGWIHSVMGNYADAAEMFRIARETVTVVADLPDLMSDAAIQFAEHLIRIDVSPEILVLLEPTRILADSTGRRNDLLKYQLIKAVLLASLSDPSAIQEFDLAMQNAQEWGRLDDIIKAQIARGSFAARRGDIDLAYQDLNAAINRAVEANFKLFEIDASIGLGWAYLLENNWDMARDYANRAVHDSKAIGYHWGEVDATALKQEIEKQIQN